MTLFTCKTICINFLWMEILLITLILKKSEARIGYFWHVTDLHLDTIYSSQGDVMRSCWHIERQSASSSTHSPGRFGDYLCESPWSLIESAAKAMKSRQGDNVEFVLWTGDGLSHSAHPMPEMKKMEILRNITDLLGRTFSSQFVFPVLGHEDGTTTNFRRMGELWRHWLPTEALHTFEKGQIILQNKGLPIKAVLILDTGPCLPPEEFLKTDDGSTIFVVHINTTNGSKCYEHYKTVLYKTSSKDVTSLLMLAWQQLNPEVIEKCWQPILGYNFNEFESDDEEENVPLNILKETLREQDLIGITEVRHLLQIVVPNTTFTEKDIGVWYNIESTLPILEADTINISFDDDEGHVIIEVPLENARIIAKEAIQIFENPIEWADSNTSDYQNTYISST